MVGKSGRLAFISRLAIDPANHRGLVYVNYAVDTDDEGTRRLRFHETNLGLLPVDREPESPEIETYRTLLAGMEAIRFEYLSPRGDDGRQQWHPQWDGESREGLPRAVGIRIVPPGEARETRLVIGIPIAAENGVQP